MKKLLIKSSIAILSLSMAFGVASISTNKSVSPAKAKHEEYSVSFDLTTNSYSINTVDLVRWESDEITIDLESTNESANAHVPTDNNGYTSTVFSEWNILTIDQADGCVISDVVFTTEDEDSVLSLAADSIWENVDTANIDTSDSAPWTATVPADDGDFAISCLFVGDIVVTNITIYYSAERSFTKIMSVDDLYDSMIVEIGASDYSALMSQTQNYSNRGKVSAEQDGSNDAIAPTELGWQRFNLYMDEYEDGTIYYTFCTVDDYYFLRANGNGESYILESSFSGDSFAYFTISITDGNATIEGLGDNDNRFMRYDSSTNVFSCYGSADDSISIYAEPQNIIDRQKVDTFVVKYMKMNSVSVLDNTAGNGCKANWSNVLAAYNALTDDQRDLFVANYDDEFDRLAAWADANGYEFGGSGDTSLVEKTNNSLLIRINENTNSNVIIITIAVISVLSVGLFFFIRKRREQN